MNRPDILRSMTATLLLGVLGWAPGAHGAAIVFSGAGPNNSDATLLAARDSFRTNLGGGTTVGANGSFGGLRREINWDGVPAASSAPNNLTANFFNVNSPRGVVFSTAGTGFQVSGATTDAGAGQPAAANFGNINASYTAQFQQFSPQRLFTPVGSTITDVSFFLPGTTTPATVGGFGAMFSDVDVLNDTTIQLFNAASSPLGTFSAPVGSLSFLGISFNAGERIGSARITSGNLALAAANNENPPTTDLVVMDDFIYSEPVPEPSSLALLGAAALFLARRRRSVG